ncbi:polygalacturonase inhibitor 1-like [Chenopodium quinoa]|uniref:polygalacturonase inhibitor 1-like n=1 Tax=Chenopodium quinoa TaxID=63459 RepID=UPI000B77EBCE|nr:polygalacturonase inhibitor 1-like [Chenopodium quinoa]
MQAPTLKCSLFFFCYTFLLFLSSLNLASSAIVCNPSDKKALLDIKYHFHNVSAFKTWDPKTDCCNEWSGVLGCDKHGHVTTLDFTSYNLTGPIPSSLGQLRKLKTAILHTNNLSGHIPSFLGFMRNLEFLYLYDNKLTGPIPSSLSQLPKISAISLGLNQLTGSIPESFGSFKSPLITSLSLYSNKLSGSIPRSVGKANIQLLDLNDNKFTGDASFLFSKDNTSLFNIDISNNLFHFDFSNVDLPQSLEYLNISHNKIYGSLPKRLGQLPLKKIDVSFNQLCGKIPTGRRLKQFSPVFFSHNKCLCGPPLAPCH